MPAPKNPKPARGGETLSAVRELWQDLETGRLHATDSCVCALALGLLVCRLAPHRRRVVTSPQLQHVDAVSIAINLVLCEHEQCGNRCSPQREKYRRHAGAIADLIH